VDGLSRKTAFAYDDELNVEQIKEFDWYLSTPAANPALQKDLTFETIDALPFQRVNTVEIRGLNPANSTFERISEIRAVGHVSWGGTDGARCSISTFYVNFGAAPAERTVDLR
jgi:hypothetical protein